MLYTKYAYRLDHVQSRKACAMDASRIDDIGNSQRHVEPDKRSSKQSTGFGVIASHGALIFSTRKTGGNKTA
jgi:hypothetical protein